MTSKFEFRLFYRFGFIHYMTWTTRNSHSHIRTHTRMPHVYLWVYFWCVSSNHFAHCILFYMPSSICYLSLYFLCRTHTHTRCVCTIATRNLFFFLFSLFNLIFWQAGKPCMQLGRQAQIVSVVVLVVVAETFNGRYLCVATLTLLHKSLYTICSLNNRKE